MVAAFACLFVLCSCASFPAGRNDPLEPANRAVFAFNARFNDLVTLPIAWVYVYRLPRPLKAGLHNALSNLESPVTFSNDLLQRHVQSAAETLARFLINSSFGLGGVYDFAARNAGLPGHAADFGQTLARYGVGPGPFLVLPIVGPTTPRDALGSIVDLAADPLAYIPAGWPLWAHAVTVIGVKTAGPFESSASTLYLRTQMSRSSVDPYATMRSAYRQHRAGEIGDGMPDLPPD